jgi:hypothetical protein
MIICIIFDVENFNDDSFKTCINLEILSIFNNRHIYDLDHLIKLTKLCLEIHISITDESIVKCTELQVLQLCLTNKITKISHLTNLKELIVPSKKYTQ